MAKVLVAMSGGVDSSVCAWLLKEQGYDCVAATMRLYDPEVLAPNSTCGSNDDVNDAKQVAARVGIPHHVFDARDAFEACVIKRFVHTYERGDTPNPCVDCNRYIKFSYLYEKAKELGCDYIATGHYAQILQDATGHYQLKKGCDKKKDQSYVLYSLTQDQLAHTLLPLGDLSKDTVREIAEEQGFINANKRDSQDICFVPDGDYAGFLQRYTQKKYPGGNFVDEQGNILGQHKGMIHYTIGQRKGLGIAAAQRLYVVAKNLEKNEVVLGTETDGMTDVFFGDELNLISMPQLSEPTELQVCIRYHQQPQEAIVTQVDESSVCVQLKKPQRGIAAGQAVVFYQGDSVVGGATIRDERA